MHWQHVGEQLLIADAFGDAQRFAGPARSGSELLVGQEMAKGNAERGTGLREEDEYLTLGMTGGDARFQPRDERPQLVDRLGRPAAVAGDLGWYSSRRS